MCKSSKITLFRVKQQELLGKQMLSTLAAGHVWVLKAPTLHCGSTGGRCWLLSGTVWGFSILIDRLCHMTISFSYCTCLFSQYISFLSCEHPSKLRHTVVNIKISLQVYTQDTVFLTAHAPKTNSGQTSLSGLSHARMMYWNRHCPHLIVVREEETSTIPRGVYMQLNVGEGVRGGEPGISRCICVCAQYMQAKQLGRQVQTHFQQSPRLLSSSLASSACLELIACSPLPCWTPPGRAQPLLYTKRLEWQSFANTVILHKTATS